MHYVQNCNVLLANFSLHRAALFFSALPISFSFKDILASVRTCENM